MHNKSIKRVSLKIKSIILVSVPIIATGICIYMAVLNIVNKKMTEIYIRHAEAITNSMVENLREFILPEPDTFMLSSFTRAMIKDKNIVYAKILDVDGKVLRSSSKKGIDYSKEKIYEMSIPIMFGNEKIGGTSVGFSTKTIEQTKQSVRNTIIVVTGGILIVWVIITGVLVSVVLIKPINRLTIDVDKIGQRLSDGNFENLDIEGGIHRNDEIGLLANTFNNMLKGLRERGFIERMFGTFVAKQVVDKILSGNDKKQLSDEGEKREVTILFADIRGFTTLATNTPPRILVELLNKCFAIMVDVIFKYEGVIDKYVGDQIMAFWGAPVEQKNAALKAVSSGIEIQKRIRAFNKEREKSNEEPIYVGIGISTGEVIAGSVGTRRRMEYTVIGDPVNLAERIESASRNGQVYISEKTYLQVKDFCEVIPLGPTRLKGRQEDVLVYEVISIK